MNVVSYGINITTVLEETVNLCMHYCSVGRLFSIGVANVTMSDQHLKSCCIFVGLVVFVKRETIHQLKSTNTNRNVREVKLHLIVDVGRCCYCCS
jgi:hypothetical protein